MYKIRLTARSAAVPHPTRGMMQAVHGAFLIVAACAMVFLLSGCVGTLPGGTETINKAYYNSNADFEAWVESLEPGMSREETFARLGRVKSDFRRLDRSEIVGVLFGGEDAGIPVHFHTDEKIMDFLNSLEGYRIEHKNIKRRHGFASAIRMQTDSKGFDYNLNLVFKDGILYQKPYLSGGTINNTNTRTLFDYFNPGMILGVVD